MIRLLKSPSKTIADQQLIADLKQGGRAEEEAVAYILSQNKGKTFAVLGKMGAHPSEQEALFLEGVSTLVMNVRNDKFKAKSSLSTYLIGICRLVFLNTKHQLKHTVDIDGVDVYEEELMRSSHEGLTEMMHKALLPLGETCRKVLQLFYLNYPMEEIAAQTGFKTAQNAMNKKYKCFKKLMQQLDENPKLKAQLRSYL